MNDSARYLERLSAVRKELGALTSVDIPQDRRTAPDPPTGETWVAANVWSHLNEFPAYWLSQFEHVLSEYAGEPVPFGRTKKDPLRIAAVHARLDTSPALLYGEIQGTLDDLASLLTSMQDDDWDARGLHETLGVMSVPKMLDEFLVGHLEEHRDQLESLLD